MLRVDEFLTISIPRYVWVWSLLRACWRWCGIVYSVCVGGWVNLTPDMILLACAYMFLLPAFILKACMHTCGNKYMRGFGFWGFDYSLFCILWISFVFLCVSVCICVLLCMCKWVCLSVDFCWPDSWTAKQHNRSLTLIPTAVTIPDNCHPTVADQGILGTCVCVHEIVKWSHNSSS